MFDWLTYADRLVDFWSANQEHIVGTAVSIAVIIGLILLLRLALTRVTARIVRGVVTRAETSRRRDPDAIKNRADTMVATVRWVIEIFLLFLGGALVLSELGFNVTAIVAGLGLAGIGLGLAAQSLFKDLINGMFILVEDQFGVGDIVEIGTVSGVVEDINPRRTLVRDLSGNVHIIPNSAIVIATNMTQDFSRINLDIRVAYDEDVDRAIEIINEECAGLAEDFSNDMVQPPSVLRVNALETSSVDIKVLGDVRIGTQWALMGELRRRVKKRFDAEGFEIPYPHQTSIVKRRNGGPGLSDEEAAAVD